MATSNALFDLIKSLTPNEKSYFKKNAYKQERAQKSYLQLFDAIDRQAEYDESKLLRKFAKHKMSKQFSTAKNYLYNLIIRALATTTAKRRRKTKMLQTLREVKVLMNRGLKQQALKK